MKTIFVAVSIVWIFCAYKLLQRKILAREGLLVNFLLLTFAWAGLNTLLGLIQLFDFIESIDKDLMVALAQDLPSFAWIMFCFTNGFLNIVFGGFLILNQIKRGRANYPLIKSSG